MRFGVEHISCKLWLARRRLVAEQRSTDSEWRPEPRSLDRVLRCRHIRPAAQWDVTRRRVTGMELSFFIEEVWLASCPSPLSIFLSPPRFLLPGSPSSILPYTRRPSLLQRGNTFHNISTLCRQYCIFLYDIPD